MVADLSEGLARCDPALQRLRPIVLSWALAIQHLNLPLPSAITMARRCSLQRALRAGRLGSEAKVG